MWLIVDVACVIGNCITHIPDSDMLWFGSRRSMIDRDGVGVLTLHPQVAICGLCMVSVTLKSNDSL